ncbi:hypothetical protein BJ165DRAFT_1477624 [Panaeolus papilionaceus]|nr:hypothetical protein BJ165DRAFT_1477624 [Panaeolus papilionaceus]
MPIDSVEDFGPGHRVFKRMPWFRPPDPDFPFYRDSTPNTKLPTSLVGLLEHNDPLSTQVTREVRALHQAVTSTLSKNKQESAVILENIQKVKKQLGPLQTQCRELEKRSQELQSKLSLLCEQNLIYTLMLSPIRTLPQHILQRIIMQCIDDSDQDGLGRFFAVMRLAHVCKLFRAIVKRTPRLWNNISISWESSIMDTSPGKPSNPINLINYSSLHCKQLPLSVKLDEDAEYLMECLPDDNDERGVPITLKWMITQWTDLPRLKHLGIRSARIDIVMPKLTQYIEKKLSIPTISSLSLQQRDSDVSSTNQTIIPNLNSSFRRMPGLRHLQLFFRIQNGRFPVHVLPTNDKSPGWANLTTLQLFGSINRSIWTRVLKNCPNLKTGGFDVDDNEKASDSAPSKFNHRHLNELVVEFSPFNTFAPFLSDQRFPSLTTLDVQFFKDMIATSGEPNKKRTSAIKETTLPALKHLVLVNAADVFDKPKRLYPLFSSLSSITHLTITLHRKDVDDFARFLRGTPAKGCNFRNLQQLNLRFVPSKEWDSSAQSLRDFTKLLLSIQQDRQEALSKKSWVGSPSDFKLVVWFIWVEGRYVGSVTYPMAHEDAMRTYFSNLQEEFSRTDFKHLAVRLKDEHHREDSNRHQNNKLGRYFDVNSGLMV